MGLSTQTRADALNIGFFERELEYRETEIKKRLLPDYPAAEGKIVPFDTEEMRWAQRTSYKVIDGIGKFERGTAMTSNLPMVQMVGKEFAQPVQEYRSGYMISEDEIIASQERNIPIEEQKIALVQQAYVEQLNLLVLQGDYYDRMPGLINNPSWLYTKSSIKLDGSTTDPRTILAQLNAGVQAGLTVTNKIMKYDTLLLPKNRYDLLLSELYMSDLNLMSVLTYFLQNNPSITSVQPLAELENAGIDGGAIAIFYKRDPLYFKFRITGSLRPRPLFQKDAWNWYRGYDFKSNGIIVYRRYAANVLYDV